MLFWPFLATQSCSLFLLTPLLRSLLLRIGLVQRLVKVTKSCQVLGRWFQVLRQRCQVLCRHQAFRIIPIKGREHDQLNRFQICKPFQFGNFLSHFINHRAACGAAQPSVLNSDRPSSIIKGPNIRSFVAKSVLSRFTRFLVVKAQTKHCQIGQLHDSY